MLSPRILYVEDDDDIRGIVTQALASEGFEVSAVSSAEDALRALRAGTFDVLLTDYRLPGNNGAWLLREGRTLGLLSRTPVIVLSSESDPSGIEGHQLLCKPIDLDVLSSAITETLKTHAAPPTQPSDVSTPAKLLLTLYVTSGSRSSQKATRNLHRLLQPVDPTSYRVAIRDVATLDSAEADDDRIVVTPTLVLRMEGGRVWVAGDLSDTRMVADLIARGLPAPLPAAPAA
jgi:DNA-binding response OmpR family regulator